MALLRMTEKKLAANRANARLSKGPITPAGKEKVSRSACKHHLFARKFLIHPEWEARIWAVVKSTAASIENPVERALAIPYLFLSQWILELDAFEVRLLDQSIADQHGSIDRGMHAYATQNHLVCPIHIMMNKLHRRARRAYRDWQRVKKALCLLQTLPHLADFTPVAQVEKTLTMAAGAGSAGFFNTIDRAAGHANAPAPVIRRRLPLRSDYTDGLPAP